MSGRLQDRTVLITGASGGIGAAIVRAVVKAGARVIVHYGRGEDEARALLKEIDGRGWDHSSRSGGARRSAATLGSGGESGKSDRRDRQQRGNQNADTNRGRPPIVPGSLASRDASQRFRGSRSMPICDHPFPQT